MSQPQPDSPPVGSVRRTVEFFFPQFEVNRVFPRQPVQVRRGRGKRTIYPWRWLRHQLTLEQARWIANRAAEYWIRWFIAFGATLFVAVKVGPPYGAFIHLGFTLLAAWTLLGVAVAVGLSRKHPGSQA